MSEAELRNIILHAVSFEQDGRLAEAESLFKPIAELDPPVHEIHQLYANLLLLKGRYDIAWPYFQGRLKTPFYRAKATMKLPRPWWRGEPIADKTLLIHVDQGLGDAILCARFLPEAKRRAGRVMLAVHAGVKRLFQGIDPDLRVVELGDPVPEFDVHVDLFSLPVLFEAGPGRMPQPPYLFAEAGLAAEWAERLAGEGPAVGLAWQGNPDHVRDDERSISVAELAPVLATEGVRFFGLQVGAGAEQAADVPAKCPFTDLGPELALGMHVTAAAVAGLDLVISVDSAVAHLAAAMGRSVWLPTYMVPDWRWATVTATNPLTIAPAPWYPDARVFAKETRWDWAPVVEDLARALAEFAAGAARAAAETAAARGFRRPS